MTLTPINLGVQSNPARDSAAGAARLINCYAESAGDEAKVRFPIYASDGFEDWATLTGGGGIRAMLQFSSTEAYVVSGTKVFKITTAPVVTELTGTVSASGRVTMARNRREPDAEVGIACDGVFHVIDTSGTTLSTVDLSGLGTGTLVSLSGLDGYFILGFDNGEFFVTNIDNATTIDALDFATAESHPDSITSTAVWGRDVAVFGTNSTEFWQNTGATPFPFDRTAAMSVGCYAPASVVEIVIVRSDAGAADNVIWAASDSGGSYAGIMMLSGYSGQKISSHAVDRSITAEADPNNISATKWTQDGNVFYAISGTAFTWVYNTSTGFWHEMESSGETRWRISHVMAFAGTNIAGDFESENLYDMNPDVYDEAGTEMTMTIIPPAVHAWPYPIRVNSLHLDPVPGVGLASGASTDTDPTISLEHSKDNGTTWSTPRLKKIGTSTQKSKRQKWIGGIGQSYEDGFLFRIKISARVFKGVMGMAIDQIPVEVKQAG